MREAKAARGLATGKLRLGSIPPVPPRLLADVLTHFQRQYPDIEGLGITILPCMMLPEKLEGISGIPLDPPLHLQIGLAVQSPEMASPGAKLFVQTAVAWIQEQASLLSRIR